MGRQFSFFLGPDDLEPFEQVLCAKGDVAFVADRPLQPLAVELNSLAKDGFRTLLARPGDLAQIKFTPVRTQNFFTSDVMTQDFIECDVLTEPYKGYLREGRLYYTSAYWDALEQHKLKSNDFLKWGEALFRRTKKSLTKFDQYYYAGKHALRLREQSLKFNQLDGWAGSD